MKACLKVGAATGLAIMAATSSAGAKDADITAVVSYPTFTQRPEVERARVLRCLKHLIDERLGADDDQQVRQVFAVSVTPTREVSETLGRKYHFKATDPRQDQLGGSLYATYFITEEADRFSGDRRYILGCTLHLNWTPVNQIVFELHNRHGTNLARSCGQGDPSLYQP